MRRALRWLRRLVLGTLAIVALVVAAALILVHTDWGRGLIRARLEARLAAVYPGARIGRLDGSVLGELVVRDLVLPARDGTPLVTVPVARVQLALLPLLDRTVRIEQLVAEDVRIVVAPPPPWPPEDDATEPSSWRVDLPDIEVHGASVIVSTPMGPVTLEAIDLGASAFVDPGGVVTASAGAVGRWRERGMRVTARSVVRAGDTLSVPLAAISLGDLSVAPPASILASGSALALDPRAVTGHVVIAASAAQLARLARGSVVAADTHAAITVRPRGDALQLTARARSGSERLDAVALVDPERREASGVIAGSSAALARVTRGHVTGEGTATVAFAASRSRVRASVLAHAALADAPEAHVMAAVDAALDPGAASLERMLDHADGLVLAAGAGETRVAAVAAVRRDGTDWLVERAYAGARTRDPAAASAGRVVASGTVAAELAAEGPIARLAVRGTARGARVRYDDVAIARLGARFSAVVADRQLRGRSHVDASGVVNAGTPIGAVSLDVRNRRDRRLDVTARLRAAAAPVVVDATAVVTPGDVIAVALGHHTVRTASGRWSGAGGTIHIDDQRVLVRGVRSALDGDRAARVTVDATLGRGTGALDLHAAATAVPAAALDPSLRGVADASLAITRRRARWAGHGELHATALVLAPDTPPVDAALALAVDGRHVTLEGSASNAQIGRAHVTLAVDGPRDLTDVQAWQRVARADLRAITLGLEHVDAAALTNGRAGGTVDATLEIRDGTPSGALTIRGVPTPAGAADANVTLALSDTGLVDARARAHVGALGATTADARLRIPDRPFDVTAWRLLGARVVDDARVATEEIAIDPGLLAGLGIDAPYRGKARVAATLGAGATAAHVTVDVRELRGGALVRGVDVHAEAHADTASTTASLRVAAGERVLVTLTGARLPVSLDRWLVAPTTAWSAPLGGRLTVPRGTLRDVLALVGRDEVAQGTLEGTLDLGGTLGTPTANGTVDLLAVRVRPRVGARPPPALSSLHVDATWGGDRGRLQITGVEASRGTLLVDVTGRPDQLASVLGTVKIERFDLAPISVFLPGPLVAAHGRLDADLAMRGLDPTVGSLRGTVHLTDGRLPLSPRLGTLRRAEVTVAIDDTGITGTLTGRIGGGTVTLAARSGRDLGTTTFTGQVSKLSPIAARQPVIDGQLAGTLRRDGLRWTGEATIARASVLVPAARGNELLDEAVPEDVFFVDLPVPAPRRGPRAPERPWLVLDVTLQPTRIVVPIITADVWARGKVQVAVGDTVGLDGEVRVERGTLDVLGHRYRVDDGQLTFDGTTDALVDVKLAHAFPDLTLYARYAGRVSELGSVEPELTSDPGTYTRGQLLGFFLGGAPGGDPSQQATEAAANVLAALGSTSVGRTLKKLIPLDVIRCDPGAGLEGASCTGGRWITPKAYVSYRQKLEARQDENTGDASLEYYWRPDRVFELMGGDRGYFGLDLMVRRRW